MKTITLTQGFEAVVDDCDFERVQKFQWHASRQGRRIYAARNVRSPEGLRRIQTMHRFILDVSEEHVDHRDGDGLNNRRDNLRACSQSENNMAFRRKAAGKSSSFRGVSFCRQTGLWRASVSHGGKLKQLGRFHNQKEAAKVRDNYAKNLHGPFASLNEL